MMGRRIFIIVCALGAFVMVNVAARYIGGATQIDMTAARVYTLSDGTKDILRDLKTPVHLKLYYSADLAQGIAPIQAYAARVAGVLHRYERISNGMVTAQTIHPSVFSAAEDDALGYGIQGIPVNADGQKFYFGVAATVNIDNETGGGEDFKAIKFLDPAREGHLEQDLTKLIYDLGMTEKPTVGILSSFDMRTQDYIDIPIVAGADNERWHVVNQIKYNYNIEHLPTDIGVISNDIDILMVVHPHGFSDDTMKAITDFTLGGGRIMMFLDPFSERANDAQKSSSAPRLLSALGVSMPPADIVADRTQGVRVQFESIDSRLSVIDKLNWPAVAGAQINREHDITKALSTVRFGSAGYIKNNCHARDLSAEASAAKGGGGGVSAAAQDSCLRGHDDAVFTPLMTSTNNAMIVAPADIETPRRMITDFVASGDVYTYAALLQGGAHNINAIIVADTDMLRDEFWTQSRNFNGGTLMTQTADNGAFVVNALDHFSGNTALVGLRSRRAVSRPFIITQNLRRAAEAQYLSREQTLKAALTKLQNDLEAAQKSNDDAHNTDAAIAQYRADIVQTRQDLRAVQYDLRRDINRLGARIKLINIALMPLLVLLAAFFVPRWLGVRRR